jgi:EmrB/QacA subfamily drug resistance transporter
MFMMQLDATVVNVALPEIGASLHPSVRGLEWVIDAYVLPLACLLLIGGRLGDLFGPRRVFLIGLGMFAVGSGLCALADSTGFLIAARALQGVGAALELPATLAILTHVYTEPKQRAQAIGIWVGVAGTSLAVGPVLGGALVDGLSWQSVFVVNLPLALVAMVIAARFLGADAEPAVRGLDLPGQLLGTATLALATYAAIEGQSRGWGSPLIASLFGTSLVCLAAFIAVERRAADPVLPLGLFGDRSFAAASGCGFLMGFVLFGLLFTFALFFQGTQGMSALEAGVRFLPLSIAFILTAPLTGRLIGGIGYRLPMALGLGCVGVGALLLVRLQSDTGYAGVAVSFVVIGIGYGLASTPMAALVMGSVPTGQAGMASSVNNTSRQAGGVFGVAILGTILTARAVQTTTGMTDFSPGLRTVLFVSGACALVGAVLAAGFVRSPVARSAEASGPAAVSAHA